MAGTENGELLQNTSAPQFSKFFKALSLLKSDQKWQEILVFLVAKNDILGYNPMR